MGRCMRRNAQDIASQAAGFRARANTARRLADDVFDDSARDGLLDFAAECERHAAALEAEDASAAAAIRVVPPRASASRSRPS